VLPHRVALYILLITIILPTQLQFEIKMVGIGLNSVQQQAAASITAADSSIILENIYDPLVSSNRLLY